MTDQVHHAVSPGKVGPNRGRGGDLWVLFSQVTRRRGQRVPPRRYSEERLCRVAPPGSAAALTDSDLPSVIGDRSLEEAVAAHRHLTPYDPPSRGARRETP